MITGQLSLLRAVQPGVPGRQFVSSAQIIDEILQTTVSHWRRQSKTVINASIMAQIQYREIFYGFHWLESIVSK